MLARSFKTAKELHRTDREYTALCRVLAFFEQEQVQYRSLAFEEIPEGHWFNMSIWETIDSTARGVGRQCGTVACIGGWANHLAREEIFKFRPQYIDINLFLLFMGNNSNKPSSSITVAEAAKCLRTYLETGVVDWNRATA